MAWCPQRLAGDQAHQIADIVEAVHLAGAEFDAETLLDRDDDLDLLEGIPIGHVLAR